MARLTKQQLALTRGWTPSLRCSWEWRVSVQEHGFPTVVLDTWRHATRDSSSRGNSQPPMMLEGKQVNDSISGFFHIKMDTTILKELRNSDGIFNGFILVVAAWLDFRSDFRFAPSAQWRQTLREKVERCLFCSLYMMVPKVPSGICFEHLGEKQLNGLVGWVVNLWKESHQPLHTRDHQIRL